jgi:hypothetical protein
MEISLSGEFPPSQISLLAVTEVMFDGTALKNHYTLCVVAELHVPILTSASESPDRLDWTSMQKIFAEARRVMMEKPEIPIL